MKILRSIFQLLAIVVGATYVLLFLLLQTPWVQKYIADDVTAYLHELLETEVEIRHMDISVFGYMQIDSLEVKDRMGYPMFFASRMGTKLSLSALLDDRLHLEYVQLYGFRAALRQERPDSAWNYQFVVDKFSGNDEPSGESPLFSVSKVMVRRGTVAIDRMYEPCKAEGFDPSHILLQQIMMDGVIDRLQADTLHLSTSRVSLSTPQGFRIVDLDAEFSRVGKSMALNQCVVRLPHSVADMTAAVEDDEWQLTLNRFYLDAEDLAHLDRRLSGRGAASLSFEARGDSSQCEIHGLTMNHDALHLSADADIAFSPLHVEARNATASVDVPMVCEAIDGSIRLPRFCTSGYTLGFDGSMTYDKSLSALQGILYSPHGEMALDGTIVDNDLFDLNISTDGFDLSQLVAALGNTALSLTANGSIKHRYAKADASIQQIDFGGYSYRNMDLSASLADSLQLSLNIDDNNVRGTLKAEADIAKRAVALDATIHHLCPDALDGKRIYAPLDYSGRVLADVVLEKDLLRSYGRVELRQPRMNGSLLADSMVITATADSLQTITVASSFMQADATVTDWRHLFSKRQDKALKASVRLWDDMPLDSLFGINLSLLDTLRVDVSGETGAIMAQMGYDSGMVHDELHVAATAGYRSDSLWLDLTLNSPDGKYENGNVRAHAMLTDSVGLSDVRAEVSNLSVGYILNLVNFHSVEFDGWASGKVEMEQLKGKPFIRALLDVSRFTMNDAYMGSTDLELTYDTGEGRLGIDGMIVDAPQAHLTHAYGYVVPGRRPNSGMDLLIDTRRINAAFVNDFTKGIFEDIEGRVSGNARVYGKFSQIDLYGDLMVDTMSVRVPMLGTAYVAAGDSVFLRPGLFSFPNLRLRDGFGGTAVVDGALRHEHFSKMTYSFDIQAENLLGYSFNTFTDMPFYATAYATGNVKIEGEPGRLDVNVRCTPQRGTVLVYDTYTPTAATNTELITFGHLDMQHADSVVAEVEHTAVESQHDINIHFDLNITPESKMKVITDAVSGDAIELYGSGHITADYYNKGSFKMYGQYVVDHGQYNLSIQNIITKKFNFREGGTMTFGGPPLQGTLNLEAIYPVHGVSLNDLSSRATFNSSSVRVDCIMNLGGKCEAPRITFGFDLPNVNEDEKQMVRSLISTDEERNMQVLYLLGIGRFYSYDYQGSIGQGNVAMKSLLSSTLSSTINNVISNALGTRNWSFGTSIATGDIGWSDMDIEGLVSGRLFNNRLLINGQFGYRDRTTTGSNFIGDFDLQWMLKNNGNIALKAYSETNDRYFTKSSLTTQGIGLLMKKDFNRLGDIFRPNDKKKKQQDKGKKKE